MRRESNAKKTIGKTENREEPIFLNLLQICSSNFSQVWMNITLHRRILGLNIRRVLSITFVFLVLRSEAA